MQALLDKGANANARGRGGRTALMYAASRGDSATEGRLILSDAELSARDADGASALTHALKGARGERWDDAIRVLCRAGIEASPSESDEIVALAFQKAPDDQIREALRWFSRTSSGLEHLRVFPVKFLGAGQVGLRLELEESIPDTRQMWLRAGDFPLPYRVWLSRRGSASTYMLSSDFFLPPTTLPPAMVVEIEGIKGDGLKALGLSGVAGGASLDAITVSFQESPCVIGFRPRGSSGWIGEVAQWSEALTCANRR